LASRRREGWRRSQICRQSLRRPSAQHATVTFAAQPQPEAFKLRVPGEVFVASLAERQPGDGLGVERDLHRLPPVRKQNEPDDVHPHGHVPFGGLAMASCACAAGTQNEPDDV
jgi:hypothetical protein